MEILDQKGHPIRAQDTAHFAASRTARELKAWTPVLQSADAELYGESDTIAARAYDLERNHGVASGLIRTKTDNIVGTGLRLSAKPDYRALGRDKDWADEWSRTTEAKWRGFADTVEFDAGREQTMGGMTVTQLRTTFLTGDALALALWLPGRRGAKYATSIQAIDPARLCDPDVLLKGERVRNGIERNRYGEPVAYYIRKHHPFDVFGAFATDNTHERVMARTRHGRRRVIHLYEKLRPGQTRGRSILASVMAPFRMLDHYQRIEMQTAVANSMIAAFLQTPLSGEQIAELFGDSDEYLQKRNGWDVKLEGAGIIPLFPGDQLQSFNPSRPSTAYASFIEAVLRTISAGVHMPYELLLKDFSKVNYSSARAALLEAWRYFLAMRNWLSVHWASPIYELWLEEAVSRGEIEAPDFYENKPAYCRCRWIGPGRGWIDPLKEATAAEKRMATSQSTLEDECAEQGKDWEEVLEQRARERNFGRSIGLEDVHAPAPQGGAPQPGPDPEDDEEEDEE